MRPPPARAFPGQVQIITPFAFGPFSTDRPASNSLYYNPPSTVTHMQQACQRSHELTVRPLVELNRYKNKIDMDFSRSRPPNPPPGFNPKAKPSILTRVFD